MGRAAGSLGSASLQPSPPVKPCPVLWALLLPHLPQGLPREAQVGRSTARPRTAAPFLPSLGAPPYGGCSFSPSPHPSGESKDGLLGKSHKNENEEGPAPEWAATARKRGDTGVMPDSVAPGGMGRGRGWSTQDRRGSRSFGFPPSSMECDGGILSGCYEVSWAPARMTAVVRECGPERAEGLRQGRGWGEGGAARAVGTGPR